MVVVDDLHMLDTQQAHTTYLDEWLDLAAASNLLRAHRLRHLEWVALNTSGNHIREAVLLGSLVLLLDNNHLSHVSIAGLFHEDF